MEIAEESHIKIKIEAEAEDKPAVLTSSSSEDDNNPSEIEDSSCPASCNRLPGCLNSCIRWYDRASKKFPRISAIVFEVMLPLLSLMFTAILFGWFLALLERDNEISSNNQILASKKKLHQSVRVEQILMREQTSICLDLYFGEQQGQLDSTTSRDDMDDTLVSFYLQAMYEDVKELDDMQQPVLTDSSTIGNVDYDNMSAVEDIPALVEYMANCVLEINKKTFKPISEESIREAKQNGAFDDITFNWIHCPTEQIGDRYYIVNEKNRFAEMWMTAAPGAERMAATASWKIDQYELCVQYYNSYKEDPSMTRLEALTKAVETSYSEANGFEGCVDDPLSAGWFWIVFMTTIGYGSVSPHTKNGQALTYIFGTLCLLFFGAIITRTADILSDLLHDLVVRLRVTKWMGLHNKDAKVIIWASSFFLWLCVVSAVRVNFQSKRMHEEFSFRDGYWFAFISCTTVGLGDYPLEHSVFQIQDFFIFSVVLLLGLTLAVSFIGSLGDYFEQKKNDLKRRKNLRASLAFMPPLSRRNLSQET